MASANSIAALLAQPLELAATWLAVLAIAAVARLGNSALFLASLVALAALALADSTGLSGQIFHPAIVRFGPHLALAGLGVGGLLAVAGAFLGDNLLAATVGAISAAVAKGVWALITAPLLLLRARGRDDDGTRERRR